MNVCSSTGSTFQISLTKTLCLTCSYDLFSIILHESKGLTSPFFFLHGAGEIATDRWHFMATLRSAATWDDCVSHVLTILSMSFPEEPLNLSPVDGGGCYPASLQQTLNGDKYQIVRKLGYGPRCSTWLVYRDSDSKYFAVKVFTVAASPQAARVELPLLKTIAKIDGRVNLPVFHGNFSESSEHGSHLCVLLNPLASSVETLRLSSPDQRLPVHTVQRIIRHIVDALTCLHGAKIMHGAVKADNFLFWTPKGTEFLKPALESEPSPTMKKIKKYLTVFSQPLNHGHKWNDKPKKVDDWEIRLENFGHAQRLNYKPERNWDYCDAPETLLQDATCSAQADIWMLGYASTFLVKGNASKRINAMCTIIGDDVPDGWLRDKGMEGSGGSKGETTSIEMSLANYLHKDDIGRAAGFIRACLRVDPTQRATAEECLAHDWLATVNACSCGFCYKTLVNRV